jgi:uncharacterized protein with NRDE domain
MCVVALAWDVHPRWRLVVAGNRDEFHARPTAGLARWAAPDHLIAGRDLQSGGTWMGVSEQGRFAVLTNVRSDSDQSANRVSRGTLVTDYLAGSRRASTLFDADLDRFNPFNLIVADGVGAYFHSNRPAPIQRPLSRGVHGLSNGVRGVPWPRMHALEAAMTDWLGGAADAPAQLFDALASEGGDSHSDDAAIFIRRPVYGTRCSTVITIDHDGVGQITERCFGPDGNTQGESTQRFSWSPAAAR